MSTDLFALLCAELGHDPATVRVIRLRAAEIGVSYTEPSGMPRSTVYALPRPVEQAARAA
jgi:hypothetical protein